MRSYGLSIVFVWILVAGCESGRRTPAVSEAISPRPFVEVTPSAREILLRVAADQKLGPDWCVRLEVVFKPDARIEVNLDRQPAGKNDYQVEVDGLRVVMVDNQKTYLKGARIGLIESPNAFAFDVTFPNRDDRDRELASRWLHTESEKRKGKEK
jgi:Fe-S cluster assembly iron-binding protein IscA